MSRTPRVGSETLSPSMAEYLDRICARFEAAWKAAKLPDERPRIDDYLREVVEPERTLFFHELDHLNSYYLKRTEAAQSEGSKHSHERSIASFPSISPTDQPSHSALSLSADRTEIPGYEILSVLGRGGMGVVYKARQLALQRIVALKMILAGTHADEQDLARFRTEAEAIARLQHANIVQIHEVGEHGGLPFFSLEYCSGGSLEKKLNATPLPPSEAARLIQHLAQAMAAAHERKVIHRDLKPANVLLAEDGTPKITDFGLAKKLDEHGQTHSGAIMGTPSYMAPEQAGGKKDAVGPHSDIYALGAILYECLTGRPPFRGATVVETLVMLQSEEVIAPSRLNRNVPRDLETICLKCLERDPSRRYARSADLADDVQRYLDGRPILARSASVFERMGKWSRRHPARAGLVGMGMLLVFGLIAGVILQTLAYQKLEVAKQKETNASALADKRAHDTLVSAAREAVTRANWTAAVSNYDNAINDKCDDLTQLKVERLRCLFDFDHRPRLALELDELAKRDDLGSLSALVNLHQGDYLMSLDGKRQLARTRIREALRQPEALTDADRAYAEGMLAETSADGLRNFRLAVARNPFHHRATSALALELIVGGQFDEARRQVDFMRRHHPRDPVPSFVLIWISIFEGDEKLGREELDRLRGLLAKDRGQEVEVFFIEMRRALDTLVDLERGKVGLPTAILRLYGSLHRVTSLVQKLPEPFGFGVPGFERLFQAFVLLQQANTFNELGLTSLALGKLKEAERLSPDGLIPSLAAIMRFNPLTQLVRSKRMPQARQESLHLIQDAYRAAETPTVLIRFPYRFQAHAIGILVDAMMLADGVVDRSSAAVALVGGGSHWTSSLGVVAVAQTPPRAIRLSEQVRRLAIEGRRHPLTRSQLVSNLIEVLPPKLARVLLDDWHLDAPDDADVLRLYAHVEERAGNPGGVLVWSEQLLSRKPDDQKAIKLRDKAKEDLRKKLQPAGRGEPR